MCPICPPGTYINATARACVACASGQYQNESDAQNCKICGACDSGVRHRCGGTFEGVCPVCPPGTFINVTAKRCSACSPGMYQNESNALGCKPCGAGRFQDKAKQSLCLQHTVCVAGEYVIELGNRVSRQRCAKCPPQHFSNTSNAADCTSCGADAYQDTEGQPFCFRTVQCTPGRYVANATLRGPSRCLPCVAGRYSSGVNANECAKCSEGQFQANKSSTFCE